MHTMLTMHTFARVACSGLLAAVAVHTATAQPAPIKPGLWQVRMSQDDPETAAKMRDMQEQMKSLPPETRKQMDALMKQRGVSMGAPGEIKICLSAEQLAEGGWKGRRDQGHCKTDTTRNGNSWKFHSSCPEPNRSETDGEAVFTSNESYSVKTVTRSGEGPNARVTKMSATSKWLGADCGDIKPTPPPAKK